MKRTPSTTSPPRLESWIARAGVICVAVLSAVVGFRFWYERDDLVLAFLTLAAEAVALGGASMVLFHGRRRWGRAAGGLLVTLIAAGWCSMTMVRTIAAETHQKAQEEAEASPGYRAAEQDLSYASALYRSALAAQVETGLGPLTTQARSAENARRVEALKAERDRAQARLEALTPVPRLDFEALFRGAGVEIMKVVGLCVFSGFMGAPALKPGAALAAQRWRKPRKRKPALRVVA
jgi:hypothetical protein